MRCPQTHAMGFRVGTRTQGPESMDADDNVVVDLSDEVFTAILRRRRTPAVLMAV